MISFPDLGHNGRLGNQLFQYAFVRSTARRLGVRFYCPSWIGDRVFALADEAERAARPEGIVHTHAESDSEAGFDPAALRIADATEIRGYFQTEKYLLRDEVLDWYRFRPEAIARVRESLSHVDFSRSVAIHVRLGDMKRDPRFYVPRPGYFATALGARARDHAILVFSDAPNQARRRLRGLGDRAVFVAGNAPHEDLYLASRCRHFIGSPSTFSWWAAWLNRDPERTIVFPAEGPYRPGAPLRNPDFLCPGWETRRSLPSVWGSYGWKTLTAPVGRTLRRAHRRLRRA